MRRLKGDRVDFNLFIIVCYILMDMKIPFSNYHIIPDNATVTATIIKLIPALLMLPSFGLSTVG